MEQFMVRFHISGGRTVNGVFEFKNLESALQRMENLLSGKGKFQVPRKDSGKVYLVEKSYVVYAEVMKYNGGKYPE